MIKFIIAILASILLTACGGGGSVDPIVLVMGGGPMTKTYPLEGERAAAAALQEAAPAFEIVDLAKPGQTACEAPLKELANRVPDILVLGYGIEDQARWSADQFEDCMDKIYAETLRLGIKLVILESLPVLEGGSRSQMYDPTKVDTFEGKKRYYDGRYCKLPEIEWDLGLMPDGVTPNEHAKKLLAEQWAWCLNNPT